MSNESGNGGRRIRDTGAERMRTNLEPAIEKRSSREGASSLGDILRQAAEAAR